jgi:hypothetical protein
MLYSGMIWGPCNALTTFSFRDTHQRPIMHLIQNSLALWRRHLPESAGCSRLRTATPWANVRDDAVKKRTQFIHVDPLLCWKKPVMNPLLSARYAAIVPFLGSRVRSSDNTINIPTTRWNFMVVTIGIACKRDSKNYNVQSQAFNLQVL